MSLRGLVLLALSALALVAPPRSAIAATTWFTDAFECNNRDNFGLSPALWGWQANLGPYDAWRTDQNGGVSAKTDNLNDSVYPGTGQQSRFGAPADFYEDFLLTGHATWSNYAIEADLVSTDDDGVGVVARYSSPARYYACRMNKDSTPHCSGNASTGQVGFALLRVDTTGTCVDDYIVAEAPQSYVAGQVYRVRLEVQGEQIRCAFDRNADGDFTDAGDVNLAWTDPNPLPAGPAGLLSWDNGAPTGDANDGKSFYDNVAITGFDADADADGVSDAVEAALAMPAADPDADDDTLLDAHELRNPSFPANADTDTLPDWADTDSDNDGVPDRLEAGDLDPTTPAPDTDCDRLSNPRDPDADGDGLADGAAVWLPLPPVWRATPCPIRCRNLPSSPPATSRPSV